MIQEIAHAKASFVLAGPGRQLLIENRSPNACSSNHLRLSTNSFLRIKMCTLESVTGSDEDRRQTSFAKRNRLRSAKAGQPKLVVSTQDSLQSNRERLAALRFGFRHHFATASVAFRQICCNCAGVLLQLTPAHAAHTRQAISSALFPACSTFQSRVSSA